MLQEVTLLVGDAVLKPTLLFMQTKMSSGKWQDQYIGMTALGSVLENPNSELIASELQETLPSILCLIETSTTVDRVRFTMAWVIAKICLHVPQLPMGSMDILQQVMQTLNNRIC